MLNKKKLFFKFTSFYKNFVVIINLFLDPILNFQISEYCYVYEESRKIFATSNLFCRLKHKICFSVSRFI